MRLRAPDSPSSGRRSLSRLIQALVMAAVLVVTMVPSIAAGQDPDPNQVQGLAVEHKAGYATVSWTPVAGATDYQIARTPVDADDLPTGAEVVVGLWRPNRQVNQPFPTFADAGFNPGDRFQWRVRARFGTTVQPYSAPVFGTTTPAPGPEEFRTQFELTQGAQFTSYDSEIAWTEAIDAASDRVRVVEIGRTPQNRAINLFIIGYPAPPTTAAAISAGPTAGANCNVHGNEPSGREGCFMMIRELAFSNDPWAIDILSNATMLIVPSINGDGRAANVRGNSTGQDLNRDHARITQPETQAFAAFLRDYTPEVMVDGHEFGNNNTCDLPLLWPRHSNTAPTVHDESKEGLVEDWFYTEGAVDGWWGCPYPVAGIDGAQTFTRVNGLKNMIVTLVEARSAGGPTRPNEGNTQSNRRRKAYSQVWSIRTALDYHRARLPEVQAAIAGGIAFAESNTGPIVRHGDWDVQTFPAPHPGDSPPPNNPPGPAQIIDPPPCAYFLTPSQYTTVLNDSGNLAVELRTNPQQRLAAHGMAVEDRPAGHVVRMRQPLRGLVNIVLEPTQPPAPIIGGLRLYECPQAAVAQDGIGEGTVEDTQAAATLTILNETTEQDQPLNWTISEAAVSCDAPTDLGWVSTATGSGTTAASSSTNVGVTFDAAGLNAPDIHSGVLCVSSNDTGAPVITVPVSLQVEYPVSGLLPPPAIDFLAAGQRNPVRFSLDGDRGTGVFATGTPTTAPIDCDTLEVTGPEIRTTGGPLAYDAAGDTYRFPWLVPAAWAGTCRSLSISFDDGTTHTAVYRVRR